MVQIGNDQIALLREAVELLKELKVGIKELNKTLSGSKVRWEEAGDDDDDDEVEEEGEVRETIKDD
jgi:uncharacterized protein YqhQ